MIPEEREKRKRGKDEARGKKEMGEGRKKEGGNGERR